MYNPVVLRRFNVMLGYIDEGMSFNSSMLFSNSSNRLGVVGYLDTHENLNILRKLNKKAKDVTIHCAL